MENNSNSSIPAHLMANGAFQKASLVCMIVAIFTVRIFFISIPAAALSIIFHVLSAGDFPQVKKYGYILIVNICVIIVSAGLTIVSVYTVMNNPFYRQQIESIINFYEKSYMYDTEPVQPSPEIQDPESVFPQPAPSGNSAASGGDFI